MTNYRTKPFPEDKPLSKTVIRPWGSFKQFTYNQVSTVNLMTVLAGQRLSLQSHTGRAELWIVIDSGATVQVGNERKELDAGEEIWIKANEIHRLSNLSEMPIRVLEVAFGNWQQNDIERYKDDYNR